MAALAWFLVLGFALGMTPALAADKPLEPPPLPARYEGILPCADCPGIRYQLQLTESSFILRMRYLERGEDAVFDDIGRWSVEGSTLVLEGGREAPVLFRILDSDTLRKLDLEGQEIDSSLNYDLERVADAEPIEPRLPMLGLFSYWADAARFMSCATGESWPVAMEGDYLGLERAYMKMRSTAGEALLAHVDGRLAMRAKLDGPGEEMTLHVERFIKLMPDSACPATRSDATLENTYWRLTRLHGQPVPAADKQPEPHLVFRANDQRVGGSGGCNRIMGGYTLTGDDISFGRMASTMMACPQGMETERAFLLALERVSQWSIRGNSLRLMDANKREIARFEARPMP